MRIAGRVDRIRKYDVPVRVYVDNRAKPDRSAQVAEVVADIKSRVARPRHRDDGGPQAPPTSWCGCCASATSARTLRAAYGRDRARKIQKSLEPQCLSGFRKDAEFRIVHSDVFLVADAGDFIFYDCAYEELLQSLGPINDTDKVPWTMFNDDVQMGFFGVYDQYILNILYHPRVRPGMTRDAGARAAAGDHARGAGVRGEGERTGAIESTRHCRPLSSTRAGRAVWRIETLRASFFSPFLDLP